MKTFVITLALLVCVTGVSHAQYNTELRLFADQYGMSCNIIDAGGLVEVFVVHRNAPPTTAIQFRAPKPDCWPGAVWISDESPFAPITLGSSQDLGGWSISYQACLSGDIYVGKILYLSTISGALCCAYPVLKADDQHPEFPGPIGADCAVNPSLYGIGAGTSVINADLTCQCMKPVPVQETTWGKVKAMYE